ncbi:hypothetical protein LINPERHAP2_LOCUS16772 [Linum perenne]
MQVLGLRSECYCGMCLRGFQSTKMRIGQLSVISIKFFLPRIKLVGLRLKDGVVSPLLIWWIFIASPTCRSRGFVSHGVVTTFFQELVGLW